MSVQPAAHSRNPIRWAGWLALFVFPVLANGLIAVWLGRHISFDLLNYHFYDAYALIKNRMGFDIAPAGFQTYWNPALDLPTYWMMRNLPDRSVGFMLGAVQGLSFPILFLLYWRSSRIVDATRRWALGILLLPVAFVAPSFIGGLGSALGDNLLAVLVLSTLLMLILAGLRHQRSLRSQAWHMVAPAGLLMGIAVGLKPVMLAYAVGSTLAMPLLFDNWRDRTRFLFLYAAMGAIGGLMSNGFWMWRLWQTFRNPFFPFFANVFQSPWISPDWKYMYYEAIIPRTPLDHLLWPLHLFKYYSAVPASVTLDARFAIVYAATLAWLLGLLVRQVPLKPRSPDFDGRAGSFLLASFWLSFAWWMEFTPAYRYLVTLELLVPLILAVLVGRALKTEVARSVGVLLLFLAIILTFQPIKFGWRLAWSGRFLEADASAFSPATNAVVVLMGPSALAYIIPFAPPEVRFVRPDWDWTEYGEGQEGLLHDSAAQLLKQHDGPLYVVYNQADYPDNIGGLNRSLARFGVLTQLQTCKELWDNVPAEVMVCRLSRR